MLLSTRKGLAALLGVVFLANLAETQLEEVIEPWQRFGQVWGDRFAEAVNTLEGGFQFSQHDATSLPIVWAYSISYFFLLPVMLLATAFWLARRKSINPFRTFTLAVTLDYVISLPFFLFFPLPERWAYPDSGAILLSDLGSSSLIEWLRPISGLDNSFPSTHVSLSVLLIVVMLRVGKRFRWTPMAPALTIVLSTFVLGIHWIPDILAGAALGVLSVLLAERLDRSLDQSTTAAMTGAPIETAPAPAR